MNKKTIPYFLIVIFMTISCRSDDKKKKAQDVVTEWMGKTLEIPAGIDSYFMNKDTVAPISKAPYKIFVYTDSTGCTSCTLRLQAWKTYIQEADSLFGDDLDFLFYFQPKDEKELQFLIRRDKFEHLIFMDRDAKLLKLNSLLPEMEYQSFLLDNNNKVISIGNPTLNPRIWELYKQLIMNDKDKPRERETISVL